MSNSNTDMQPVRDWVESGGVIVYYSKGKFNEEYQALPKIKELFAKYSRSGNLVDADAAKVSQANHYLDDKKLKSNDQHILEVAIAENVEVLVTQDQDLIDDFKNKQIMCRRGKIYKNRTHQKMLSKKLCERLRKGNK